VVNAAMASQHRFDEMTAFFEGVGSGHAAGVWQDLPRDRPEFRERNLVQLAKRKKAEEPVGC
jgi:chlorophyllide a reductase subunit Y